jgi:hypothetical protein
MRRKKKVTCFFQKEEDWGRDLLQKYKEWEDLEKNTSKYKIRKMTELFGRNPSEELKKAYLDRDHEKFGIIVSAYFHPLDPNLLKYFRCFFMLNSWEGLLILLRFGVPATCIDYETMLFFPKHKEALLLVNNSQYFLATGKVLLPTNEELATFNPISREPIYNYFSDLLTHSPDVHTDRSEPNAI